MDEVSFYDRALSASEIQAIYNAGSYGKCTSCFNSPVSLVGWWPAEGDANDIFNGNNGTLQNGAGFAPGEVGQGFTFNGVNQCVQIPDAPALDPTSALTVEAWVYVNGNPSVDLATIVTKQSPTVPGQLQYQLETHLIGSRLAFRALVYLTTAPNYESVDGNTTVQLNTWYHVAMTYDGSTLNLYVNGALDGTLSAPGIVTTTTQPLRIGGAGGGPWYFNGRVDEVGIYNSALSPADIQGIYLAGSWGRCVPHKGDVIVSAGSSDVYRYSSFAVYRQTLSQTMNGAIGSSFDAVGNLYVTTFQYGTINKLRYCTLQNTSYSPPNGSPECVVFDNAGNFYVTTSKPVALGFYKYNSAGAIVDHFLPTTQVDWMDLAPDQCTVYYTDESPNIHRFNLCTRQSMPDFAHVNATYAYALRLLPSGGLLVATDPDVERFDSNGNLVSTYNPNDGGHNFFSLALAPDGNSFWVGDTLVGNLYRIDLSSGSLLYSTQLSPIYGLSVYAGNGP